MIKDEHKAELLAYKLIHYFIQQQSSNLTVSIQEKANELHVLAKARLAEEPADLAQFRRSVSVERDPFLEDYYENLLGVHHDIEYDLIGLLTDRAEVCYQNQELTVELIRAQP